MDLIPGGKVGSPTFADIKISGDKLFFNCYQYNIASKHLEAIDSYAILKTDTASKKAAALKNNFTFFRTLYQREYICLHN